MAENPMVKGKNASTVFLDRFADPYTMRSLRASTVSSTVLDTERYFSAIVKKLNAM